MLLFMIPCAAGAVLLFALGVFDDFRDVWTHPEHKEIEEFPHHPSGLRIEDAKAFRQHPEHSPTDSAARNRVIPMPEPRETAASPGTHSETKGTRVV